MARDLKLTTEDRKLLQLGLTTLEAALEAAEQPVPGRLRHLRKQLHSWLLNKAEANWTTNPTMNAREVAQQLGVSSQQVHKLGVQGVLQIAQVGHRGRNGSVLYTTDSVQQYSENRPAPGRKPNQSIK